MAIRGKSSRQKDKPFQHAKLLFWNSVDAGVTAEVFTGDVSGQVVDRFWEKKG
jgi:hypothetical protein